MIKLPKILLHKSPSSNALENLNSHVDNNVLTKQNSYKNLSIQLASQRQLQNSRILQEEKDKYEMTNQICQQMNKYKNKRKVKQFNQDDDQGNKVNNFSKQNKIGIKNIENPNNALKIKQFQQHNKNELWKPETRESTSICVLNKNIYLYAGFGVKIYQDLYQYDSFQKSWIPLDQIIPCSQVARYGHSMHGFKDKLYVFGGKLHSTYPSATNEVLIYSLATTKWENITCPVEDLIPRYNQSSCLIGRFMIIHGGQDVKGHLLDDMWGFDMQNYIFFKINFKEKFNFNSITSVFDSDRKLDQLIIEKKFEKITSVIKQEGIYFFQKKLRYLNLSNQDLKLENITQYGNAPEERTNHCATFNSKQNFYIICGGKLNEKVYNDCHIYNVCNQNWVTIEQYGDKMIPRCGHQQVYNQGEILIFGGHNYDGYINFDTFILNQDPKQDLKNVKNLKASQLK